MNHWIKKSLSIFILLIPTGLIVGFSNSWSNKIAISCVGSSAVKPFLEILANNYMKTNKEFDITIETGGSGFGIQQIAKGFANIGDASKDPYKAVKGKENNGKDGFRQQWEKNKIKTITIGWEGICMVYIPPKDLHLNYETLNKILVVKNSNINNLMRIFTGINDPSHKIDNPTLYDFYNENSNLSLEQQELLKKTSIKPYVRAGGALTSGTAYSFVNESNFSQFKNDDTHLSKEQRAAFDNGSYGINYGIQQTDEANSRAWDIFAKSDNSGQIIYLSSGFINQNIDLIKAKGYGIMAYGDNATSYDVNLIDTVNGYNWFRPLNTMINVTGKNEPNAEMRFIKMLLSKEYKDKLASIGAKSLDSDNEISQMFPNGIDNIWLSDYELASLNPNWSWENDEQYHHFAPIPMNIR